MTHDPIQTLRWSARPDPIYDGYFAVEVRARDKHGEAYDFHMLLGPFETPRFWTAMNYMQRYILERIT